MASSSSAPSQPHTVPQLVNARGSQLPDLGVQTTVPSTTLQAHWLFQGEQRLDAGFYSSEGAAAMRAVQDSGFAVRHLGQVAKDIFILGRFRRVYASNKRAGWPYLSASEALTFRPTSDRWIAKDHAPTDATKHFVKEGWLLLSCSGTVGRMTLVTKRLERFFLTHDLVRIIPKSVALGGYLYAFLCSWIGQALLSKDQYGSAIKHLEAHHVAGVPVPLIPMSEQEKIDHEIYQVFVLRDEANTLLDEADEMLHQELGLPRFDLSMVPFLAPPSDSLTTGVEMPHPSAFTTSLASLDGRFDASYHVPIAREAIDILRKGKYQPVRLNQLTQNIVIPPRFKRIYVAAEHGTPFLRPSQLTQMRPYDLGYISKLTRILDQLELHKGDVLITTDGTVGRIALVSSYINGWAGSNNIARVTYGGSDGRNGYLAAFLSSPYGYYQLTRLIYGGVIDHIEVPHIQGVLVPEAPQEAQIAIGQRVVSAFDKKDQASAIEEAAIRRVETALSQSKQP